MEVIKVWNKEENNKGGFRGTFEQKDIIENHYFEDEKVIFETIERKNFTKEQIEGFNDAARDYFQHSINKGLSIEDAKENIKYSNRVYFFDLGIGLLNDWWELGFTENQVRKFYDDIIQNW